MNTTTASPEPSETSASSDSLPSIGNTVIRLITPAIFTGSRTGASAIRVVPGTLSAQPRISAERRASSLSFNRSKKRRKTPMVRRYEAIVEGASSCRISASSSDLRDFEM